jgi:hypothetical protein
VLSVVWVLALPTGGLVTAIVKGTLDASEGGKTPGATVVEVVGGLDQWIGQDDMVHVAHLLCSQHSGQILDQLRQVRVTLNTFSASLEETNTHETTAANGSTATVQTDVRAVTAIYHDGQWIGDARGDWHTWTFDLVLARGLTHGWKVCTASTSDPFK